MHGSLSQLEWIEGQSQRMRRLLVTWAKVNTGSHNLSGLAQCAAAVMQELGRLGGETGYLDLPPERVLGPDGEVRAQALGQALHAIKRPAAPLRIFLGVHLDTVYGPDHTFQNVTQLDDNRLGGPGVADAKGGLVVMLTALAALERSEVASRIGWEVLINPDEELGSPGSREILVAAAAKNHLGLLFEPAQEDGALVAARKGSANYTVLVRGREAHAGRNPQDGRNAIHALAEFIVRANRLTGSSPGITVNVGRIEGGSVPNVVPDRAMCRLNVRVGSVEEQRAVETGLERIVVEVGEQDGIAMELSGGFTASPKPVDLPTRALMDYVIDCGREVGISLFFRDSGGVSDGSRLAAAGLPNIDSLGVCGGGLHSAGEYVLLHSLASRAKLAALLLMRLASGELPWPPTGAAPEMEIR
jgi:glutamate carboxypeptidase